MDANGGMGYVGDRRLVSIQGSIVACDIPRHIATSSTVNTAQYSEALLSTGAFVEFSVTQGYLIC